MALTQTVTTTYPPTTTLVPPTSGVPPTDTAFTGGDVDLSAAYFVILLVVGLAATWIARKRARAMEEEI